MKILHIGKYFAPFKGGVETYLRDVMTGLQAQGVECAALVHDHRRGWRSRDEVVANGQARLPVTRVASQLRFFFTPISLSFRAQLRGAIRAFGPDAIHVHLPNPSACWLLSLGLARDIPLVVHWHSDVITTGLGPLMKALYAGYRPFERRLLERAAAIVATSESYLASSESLRAYPDKCRVIPLGLDARRIDASSPVPPVPDAGSSDLQVLAIGRLTYYKGFGYLIRAAARLEGVQVHIVGTGECWRELRKLAAQLGVRGKVRFHGGISDAQLAGRFHSCDCLCLPSIERTEAFGLVLLEAMAFGKPTVISDVPGSGMGWVVADGVTGLTAAPRDDAALAEALARLRDDRALGRRLGAAGRQRFDAAFDIRHSAARLAELYRGLPGVRAAGEAR